MAPWFSGDVIANGVRLHYFRTGGNKRPIVLAHGITDNGLCWTPVAEQLQADYDLIMYDARGHGLSEKAETGYTNTILAEDLAALVEVLGLKKPALMGHSLGAATVAAAEALPPGMASCLLLEDPPWRAETSVADREAHAAQWRARVVSDRMKTRDELLAICAERHPAWSKGECGPWAIAKAQVSPAVIDYVAAERSTWRQIAPQITCPTLLIRGDVEKEAIVDESLAQEVIKALRVGREAHVPGAGHNIRREGFGPYMAAVRAFLAEYYR